MPLEPTQLTYPSVPRVDRFYRESRPLPPLPQIIPVPLVQPNQQPIAEPKYRPSPQEEVHQVTRPSEGLFCGFPEEIYISSVLPTRTPRELRHFQQHCWDIYQRSENINVNYHQGINQIHRVTTSPLNFANLLWKSKTILSIGGITEFYCWIRRCSNAHQPTRASLEPAYQVDYNWSEPRYTVSRLAQHPRI
jgi:hypothetical protein